MGELLGWWDYSRRRALDVADRLVLSGRAQWRKSLRIGVYFLLLLQVAAWLVTLEPNVPPAPVIQTEPPATISAMVRPQVRDLGIRWEQVHQGARLLLQAAPPMALSPPARQALQDALAQGKTTGPIRARGFASLEPALRLLTPAQRRVLVADHDRLLAQDSRLRSRGAAPVPSPSPGDGR